MTVHQISVPRDVRALTTLPRVDYQDAFVVEPLPAPDRTAEQWARAVLEDSPDDLRHAVLSGWSAIGFELGEAGSERHVLGWEVRRAEPDLALLGASSPRGIEGELVFKLQRQTLIYATFVRIFDPGAREVWSRIEPAHPGIVRELHERALAHS